MTHHTAARPCSSPGRPTPADDLTPRWSSVVPLPGGTTTSESSHDDHPDDACSSHQKGTTFRPGSVWLVTDRTWPAWQAVLELIIDGQWHPTTEITELMHQAADLAPRTIQAHLRSASRRGWIHQSHGRVKVHDSHAIDAALSGSSA